MWYIRRFISPMNISRPQRTKFISIPKTIYSPLYNARGSFKIHKDIRAGNKARTRFQFETRPLFRIKSGTLIIIKERPLIRQPENTRTDADQPAYSTVWLMRGLRTVYFGKCPPGRCAKELFKFAQRKHTNHTLSKKAYYESWLFQQEKVWKQLICKKNPLKPKRSFTNYKKKSWRLPSRET